MVRENPVPPRTDEADKPRPSFDQVTQQLNQAREFATVYLSAQATRLQVAIRDAVLFGVLGIVGAIVVATFSVVSVVLFLHGAAGGIGALLGGRTWAGELIIGFVVLGGAAAVCWKGISYIQKISRRKTVATYLKSRMPR